MAIKDADAWYSLQLPHRFKIELKSVLTKEANAGYPAEEDYYYPWQQAICERTGYPYYYNVETGESSWDPPPQEAWYGTTEAVTNAPSAPEQEAPGIAVPVELMSGFLWILSPTDQKWEKKWFEIRSGSLAYYDPLDEEAEENEIIMSSIERIVRAEDDLTHFNIDLRGNTATMHLRASTTDAVEQWMQQLTSMSLLGSDVPALRGAPRVPVRPQQQADNWKAMRH